MEYTKEQDDQGAGERGREGPRPTSWPSRRPGSWRRLKEIELERQLRTQDELKRAKDVRHFEATKSLRAAANKLELFRKIFMPAVFGPILGELADLGISDRGIGTVAQQPIDHFPPTFEGGVVKWRARIIKSHRDEVHLGAAIQKILRDFEMPPHRRIDEGISKDLAGDRGEVLPESAC